MVAPLPLPPIPPRAGDMIKQWLSFAFAGLAMHSMLTHGVDQWSVILAVAALGIHPDSFLSTNRRSTD